MMRDGDAAMVTAAIPRIGDQDGEVFALLAQAFSDQGLPVTLREGLRLFVESCLKVGSALIFTDEGGPAALLRALKNPDADEVILDLTAPGSGIVKGIRHTAKWYPPTRKGS